MGTGFNFILSGSYDAVVHVWSLPGLLSFEAPRIDDTPQGSSFSPLRSFSNHRATITDVLTGHSQGRNNIAVSASLDKTCIVWEYETGTTLKIFLLPNQPLCLALHPVDRAAYAGYEDGSIQLIDFYDSSGHGAPLHVATPHSAPVQPPPAALWQSMDYPGSAIHCLQISYDGTQLLSGDQDGEVRTWDMATGENQKSLVDFTAPVTNLQMLPPMGFRNGIKPSVRLESVTTPRYQGFTNGHNQAGSVPDDYVFNAQFLTDLSEPRPRGTGFASLRATDTKVPDEFRNAAIASIMAEEEYKSRYQSSPDPTTIADLQAHIEFLKAQQEETSKQLEAAINDLEELDKEDWRRQKDREVKGAKKKSRRMNRLKAAEVARKKEMGEKVAEENEEVDVQGEGNKDLSSSTDELTDH